jgi:hypothetical protein
MPEDYYRFLVRTITTVGQDPAQLRMVVYQFARSKLRKELFAKKDLRWAEMKQQMAALEKAIEQIESDVADHTVLLSAYPPAAPAAPPNPPIVAAAAQNSPMIAGAVQNSPMTDSAAVDFAAIDSAAVDFDAVDSAAENAPIVVDASRNAVAKSTDTALVVHENYAALERVIDQIEPDIYERHSVVESRFEPIRTYKPVRAAFWSTVRLVVAVVLGVALFAALENRGDLAGLFARNGRDEVVGAAPIANGHPSQSATQVAANPIMPVVAKQPPSEPDSGLGPGMKNVPIPGAYGVYAVDHDKLTDLELLPIKVPDERIGISALFSTPSASTLPDGHLQFIAFRRDLANDAPDRVIVRVVARVMHELTFDATGNAKRVDIDSLWAVRSNSYEMQVVPVSGNPAMVIIRPESSTFSFPSGRYALVLQGSAYDFSVAGSVTDTAQCLERTDAVNMPVYSECRTL